MDLPCLLLVGPSEWHEKLLETYKNQNEIWMQYNDAKKDKPSGSIRRKAEDWLREQIGQYGYFRLYGYSIGTNHVTHEYHIDNYRCSDKRISPPEKSKAPPFSDYDKSQGHCKNPQDYKYYNWLHAIKAHKLDKIIPYQDFISFTTGKPLMSSSLNSRVLLVKEIGQHNRRALSFLIPLDPVEDDMHDEGKQRLRQHLVRERSATLIAKFKESLSSYRCVICGFDFEKKYGKIGAKFIEAHHEKPVSSYGKGGKTSIKDLVAVCSNCHRMLHRYSGTKRFRTWNELKKELKD